MRNTTTRETTTLGDLVVAAFEGARRSTSSGHLAAKLAARTVEAQLRRARRADLIRSLSRAAHDVSGGAPIAAAG